MDKIDRLLDAIEHPDRYSEKDIETMLADPEVREIYDILDKTKATLTPIPAPDVDAEWNAFKNSHHPTPRRTFHIPNLFNRNIAASIAIGIVSLAAVAAVVGIGVNHILDKKAGVPASETVAAAEESNVSNDTIIATEEIPETSPETIIFDNEPLEIIATQIAEYYGYKVAFSTDTPKSLRLYFRWNQAQTIDEVVESLNNFEQIHISLKDKTIKID